MGKPRDDTFETLYQEHFDQLFRTAYRLTGNYDDAEELVQETFLLYLSRHKKLADHPNPVGWLVKALQNLARNERRQQEGAEEISLEDLEMDLAAPERALSLWEILPAGLPEEDKQLIIWKYEDRLSHREMADRLGVAEGTVRSRFSRALQKVKRLDPAFSISNTKDAAKPPAHDIDKVEGRKEGEE